MRGEVEKETPKKEMDLDVFLWNHTWHFQKIIKSAIFNFSQHLRNTPLWEFVLVQFSKWSSIEKGLQLVTVIWHLNENILSPYLINNIYSMLFHYKILKKIYLKQEWQHSIRYSLKSNGKTNLELRTSLVISNFI